MNNSDKKALKLVFTIVEHGKSESIFELLEENNIKFHFLCQGMGTAPSNFRQMLGLDDSSKDIVAFVSELEKANNLIEKISESYHQSGILFSINLSSVGGINAFNILKGDLA